MYNEQIDDLIYYIAWVNMHKKVDERYNIFPRFLGLHLPFLACLVEILIHLP